jgi:hypothetical protein
MIKHFAAAALALAALGSAAPASAQSQSFCGGRLVADSFYSTTTANSQGGSQVAYIMQLRNTTGQAATAVVSFNAPGIAGLRRNGNRLPAYGSATIRLGTQNLNNPSGAGKLQDGDIARYVVINCG